MAWNDRYGRDYGASWYDRGTGSPGYESWQGGSPPSRGSYSRTPYAGSGGNYFGYDWQYRSAPSESPNYGRNADRNLQQWARNHGYDAGYEIRPQSGRSPTFGRGAERGYGSDRGYGADRGYGSEGGYGGLYDRSRGYGGDFGSYRGRDERFGSGYRGESDWQGGDRYDRWQDEPGGRWSRSRDYRW